MSYEINFSSMLVIFVLAFLIPLAINRIKFFKIPEVIGEIVAGIVIGKSGFNIVQNNSWIEFLTIFGFTFLIFLSGLEIDFTFLKRLNSIHKGQINLLSISMSMFSLIVLMSFSMSFILLYTGINIDPLILTLIFSTISLGIVVPTLKEATIIKKPLGQAILLTAIIADFSTMLMLPIVISLATGKKNSSLICSLIIIAAFVAMYFLGKKFLTKDFINRPAFKTSQLEIRTAFALILIFVTISEFVDLEIILGAFLAGILFSLFFQKSKSEILPKLDAIGYGLLIPVFFIMTGANFDLKTVLADRKALLLLPFLIISAYIVKLIPALVFKKYFNWRETIGAGFLLSSNLSLTIAIAFIARNEGLISESLYSTFLLFAIFTCIISPMIFYDIVI